MIDFKNKKVVVLGLGRSGLACAKLLKNKGAIVFVSEKDNSPEKKELSLQLKENKIDFELGKHTRSKIEENQYLVVSPGIPLSAEPLLWARVKNIEIIGEIEVAYQVCPATIIAITGTNGKTTVTTLIGEVLKEAGKNAFVLGNIGAPFCSGVEAMKQSDFVSLEVSSFQLETIREFRPKVGVILNLTPDHLDRYKDVEEYLEAKKRIFLNQTEDDILILNNEDIALRSLADQTKAKVLSFTKRIDSSTKNLNLNQLAVFKVAEALGISSDVCLNVFKRFRGIKHRLEFVEKIKGVEYINDSKATNVDSARWALQNINKPIILIAGGRDKGADFSLIKDLLRKKVKTLILFGEAKEKMKDAFSDMLEIIVVEDIKKAIEEASHKAREGECVLLSPMCASFDMFSDYQHRGRVFKDIVRSIK